MIDRVAKHVMREMLADTQATACGGNNEAETCVEALPSISRKHHKTRPRFRRFYRTLPEFNVEVGVNDDEDDA